MQALRKVIQRDEELSCLQCFSVSGKVVLDSKCELSFCNSLQLLKEFLLRFVRYRFISCIFEFQNVRVVLNLRARGCSVDMPSPR